MYCVLFEGTLLPTLAESAERPASTTGAMTCVYVWNFASPLGFLGHACCHMQIQAELMISCQPCSALMANLWYPVVYSRASPEGCLLAEHHERRLRW